MERVKLILAGFGAMSKLAWCPLIQQTPAAEMVACVDPDPEAFSEAIEKGYLTPEMCFSSLCEAIAVVKADGVIVVTPPNQHEAVCLEAAKAGLHILCEKPLAPSLEAAKRMVQAAEDAGVQLMIAQNRRHTAFIHTMRNLVQSNRFGKAGQVYVTFRQIFTRDSFRDTMEHPLLIDMANHHFDTIRYVLGEEPAGVAAVGWNPDWSRFRGIASAVVVFDYKRNLRVVYDGSWHAMNGEMTSNGCDWRIECEDGVIVCRGERVYTAPRGEYASGSCGGVLTEEKQVDMRYETTAYLFWEFLQVITKGRIPETSGEDNIHTLNMVFAAVQAVDTGKHVQIK